MMKRNALEKELDEQRSELRQRLVKEARTKLSSLGGELWNAGGNNSTAQSLFHSASEGLLKPQQHRMAETHDEEGSPVEREEQKSNGVTRKKKQRQDNPRAEREGQYSMLTKDNTWQQIGKLDSTIEKPASRKDVLQLQKQFERAMHASQREIRQTRKPGSGLMAESRMEQDIVATKEAVRQLLQPVQGPESDQDSEFSETQHALEGEEFTTLHLRTSTETSQRQMELQSTLTTALFEQKWSDLVLGELQGQVMVSCLEQGKLLTKLRNQLATCFGLLCTGHSMTVHDLNEMTDRMRFYKKKAVELTQKQGIIREELKEEHENDLQKVQELAEEKYAAYEIKLQAAEGAQRRLSETLSSLNAVYRKMREDGDVLRTMDLSEACTALEKKLKQAQKELEELRPLRALRDDLLRTVDHQKETITELNERIGNLELELEKREGLMENLMQHQSRILSLEELEKEGDSGVRRASSADYEDEEESEEDDEEDDEDEEDEEDEEDDGVEEGEALEHQEEHQEKVGSEVVSSPKKKKGKKKGTKKSGGKKKKGTKKGKKGAKKKKTNPANDKYIVGKKVAKTTDTVEVDETFSKVEFANGAAEEIREGMDPPSTAKTFLCPRCSVALDRAGNIDEQFMEEKKRLACEGYRMLLPNLMGYRPERPRSWVIRCMRCIIRAKRTADFSADRAGKLRLRFPEFVYMWFSPRPERLKEIKFMDGDEAVLMAKAEADENRWALYYGVKKLFTELPEARVFYTFLDEKFGEDDFAFYLHCLTILEAVANEKHSSLNWGPNTHACDYDAMKQEEEAMGLDEPQPIEDFIFVEIRHAVLAVERVMARATEDDCKRAVKTLVENAVQEEVRITPTTGQRIIDINVCLRVLLQEYRDEQAHRRAAVRLMFGCASSGPDEQVYNKSVDLGQVLTIVTTLNSRAGPVEAITLYRLAFELGHGKVTLDSFTKAANRINFFTDCLRLPPHYGTEAPNNLTSPQCVQLGTIVRQQMALLKPTISTFMSHLEPNAQRQLVRLEDDVNIELSKGGLQLDGRRSLCALRRLLFFLVGERIGKRELFGEQDSSGEVTLINTKKELEFFGLMLRDFTLNEREERLNALQLKNSAALIQQKWRRKQEMAPGIPLHMRKLMSVCFEPGLILPASVLENKGKEKEEENTIDEEAEVEEVKRRLPRTPLRPVEWVLLVLDEIYRYKMHADYSLATSFVANSNGRSVLRNTSRVTLEEAVHSVAMSFLGVRAVAERYIHDFFVNVHHYAGDNIRIRTFARFTGVRAATLFPKKRTSALDTSEDDVGNLDIENEIGYGGENDWSINPLNKLLPKALEHHGAADTYVAALGIFYGLLYNEKTSNALHPLFPPGTASLIPLEIAINGVKTVFQEPNAAGSSTRGHPCSLGALPRVVEECMTRLERLTIDHGRVDLDCVLLVILQGWHSEQILRKRALHERIKEEAVPDLISSGGMDVPLINHVFSVDDFVTKFVPQIEPTLQSNSITTTWMFRTLSNVSDPKPTFSCDMLVKVLKENETLAWSPNRPELFKSPSKCAGVEDRWRQLVYVWTPLQPTVQSVIEELRVKLASRIGLIISEDALRYRQQEYREYLSRMMEEALEAFLKVYDTVSSLTATSRTLESVEECWTLLRSFFSVFQSARAQVGLSNEPIRDQYDVDSLRGKSSGMFGMGKSRRTKKK